MVYAVLSGGPHRIYDTVDEAMAGINRHALKNNKYWIKSFVSRFDAEKAIEDREYDISVMKGKHDKHYSYHGRRKKNQKKANQ